MGHADIAAGRGVLWLYSLICRSGCAAKNAAWACRMQVMQSLRHDVANLECLPFARLMPVAPDQALALLLLVHLENFTELHTIIKIFVCYCDEHIDFGCVFFVLTIEQKIFIFRYQ